MKKIIAAVLSLTILSGAYSFMPESSRTTPIFASASTSVYDSKLEGIWSYDLSKELNEAGAFCFLNFGSDGSFSIFIGYNDDYILGRYESGLYGKGTYTTTGNVLNIDFPDEITEENGDILIIANFDDLECQYEVTDNMVTLTKSDDKIDFSKQVYDEIVDFGDVNGDNSISVLDSTYILNVYAAEATGRNVCISDSVRAAADIDKNGNINVSDATYLLKYYSYYSMGGKDTLTEYINKG